MNIPVDGVIIQSSGVTTNEAAMTGESEEQKKESLEHCKARLMEREAEDFEDKGIQKCNASELPSPILLSGT